MSKIIQNTTNLQSILNTINNLPEAGGDDLDTSDATATAADILSGKTAYVDGEKITGTINSRTASNLSANGATVTVAPGYYPAQMTKTISSGSATTPATTITKTPTISVSSSGLITASVSGTQSVTPTVTTGYVSSGTAGAITVSGSATKQLTAQAAQTITPGTSNKTISSGRYLTGTQTIKGDANLVADNIKSGVSIFGVTGTYSGSGGGANLETSTVTIAGATTFYAVSYTTVDSSGNIIYKTDTNFSIPYVITCLKNSCVVINSTALSSNSLRITGASLLFRRNYYTSFGISDTIAEIYITNIHTGGGDD